MKTYTLREALYNSGETRMEVARVLVRFHSAGAELDRRNKRKPPFWLPPCHYYTGKRRCE